MDIQLILEFKNSFGKYHPVCPFLGTPVYIFFLIFLGPILLGLGIAAATLFYAYFNAFSG